MTAPGIRERIAIALTAASVVVACVFGVGTRMGVSADHPYLDTAYKLVSYKGRPVMKLSSGKVSAPGRKQVFRRSNPFSDLVGLHDEKAPAGRERVLEPLMVGGTRRGGRPPIAEVRARFAADLEPCSHIWRRLKAGTPEAGESM